MCQTATTISCKLDKFHDSTHLIMSPCCVIISVFCSYFATDHLQPVKWVHVFVLPCFSHLATGQMGTRRVYTEDGVLQIIVLNY